MSSVNRNLSKGKQKEMNPRLRSKINNLEVKYIEFVNNCSSYLQSPHPHSQHQQRIPNDRIGEKRGKSNEYQTENVTLKRKNEILTKTVDELNTKISALESLNQDANLNKEFSEKIQKKKEFLEKQEMDLIKLKNELERSKLEVSVLKNNYTERDRNFGGEIKVITKSKSPLSHRYIPKARDYSPIDRKPSVSPMQRGLSPRDIRAHSMKKKLKSVQEKLVKTLEERDFFKNWKRYCIENPPLPPALKIIIEQYENEIKKLDIVGSILRNNTEKFISTVKGLILELNKCQGLRNNQQLENLKMKVTDMMKGMHVKITMESPGIKQKQSLDMNLFKKSQKMYEKENRDLEDILRREQSRADYISDELEFKTSELVELRQTVESFQFSEKYNSFSAPITAENFFDSKSMNGGLASANDYYPKISNKIEELPKFHSQLSKFDEFTTKKLQFLKESFQVKLEKIENIQKSMDIFKKKYRTLRQSENINKSKYEDMITGITEDNELLKSKLSGYELEVYENLKNIQILSQIVQSSREENANLSENIIALEKSLSKYREIEEGRVKNGSKLNVNWHHTEKSLVYFSMVFESSLLIPAINKEPTGEEKSNLKCLSLLRNNAKIEITPESILQIIGDINDAKSVKDKYLDAMKNYIDLKHEYDHLESSFTSISQKYDDLVSTSQDRINKCEYLQGECDFLKNKFDDLAKISSLHEDEEYLKDEKIISQKKAIDDLLLKNEKLINEFAEISKKSEKFNVEKQKLTEIIQVFNKDLEENRRKSTDLYIKLESSLNENKNLAQQCELSKENAISLQIKLDQASSENKSLTKINEDLKENVNFI